MTALLVTLAAGALGAVLRFLVTRAFAARPVGAVLLVNVVGSAIGGGVLALAQLGSVSGDIRLVLLTGFCGGLTTFSTFGVETIQLVLAGKAKVAALSVLANLVLGIGAATVVYGVVIVAF
ncbi:MAG: CrcB family protein [Rhodoglobus sp.]|nr:CrcB family protein [Rhodoglobus sp.]